MKFVRLAALLLAVLTWVAPARAQAGDTAAIRRHLSRACPGGEVRLALANADTLRGYCGFVQDDRLVVRRGTDERRVPLEQVEALWVRTRGTGSGTRAGAVIGGLGLAGAFMFVANGICDNGAGCGSDVLQVGAIGGFLGALAGAATGGMIGSRVNGWVQRYP